MRAILSLYMIDVLGVTKEDSGTYMSLFIAACYLLPLVGGFIADRFLGKYWTIVAFSAPYVLGQLLVGIQNQYILLFSLFLLAMGSGVIKPNISTLMGLTYDEQRPGNDRLRTSAFEWFYFAINFGAFLSQSTLPMVRDTYGYQAAFLVPAGLMAVALAVFAMGKPYYAKEVISRQSLTPEQKTERWVTFQRIAGLFGLCIFFWAVFDQSASTWIFFADVYMNNSLFGYEVRADAIQSFNALFILIFLPLMKVMWMVLDSKGIRVKPTGKMLAGFVLTAVSMAILGISGLLAGKAIPIYRITGNGIDIAIARDPGANLPTKPNESTTISLGEKFELKLDTVETQGIRTTFDNAVLLQDGAALVTLKDKSVDSSASPALSSSKLTDIPGVLVSEYKLPEKTATAKSFSISLSEYVKPEERVTVWWQVLAYLVLTIAEILISVTGLELAFVAAPPSTKSFVTACWLFTVFLANFFINAPITRLYAKMDPSTYFFMLAGALAVVSVAFIFVGRGFNRVRA